MKLCIMTGGLVEVVGYEAGYAAIAKAGFEAIDWNLDQILSAKALSGEKLEGLCIFEKELDEIMAHYEEELSYINKNRLAISQMHAPFPCYIVGKPQVFEYMIGIYKKMILFCDRIGCKNLIVHGFALPRTERSMTIEEAEAINDRLYTSLIPELLQTDVTVCLENLFAGGGAGMLSGVCSDAREAVEMIDVYNQIAGKECFGFCLDTGHMNLTKQDPRKFIPIIGHRLKALHLHDNSGLVDEHKAPYTGTIVWQDVYTSLKQIGYSGDLSFETFKQVLPSAVDSELTEPWLELICKIGKFFRNKIIG